MAVRLKLTLTALVLVGCIVVCLGGYGNRYSRSRYNWKPKRPPMQSPPQHIPPVQRPPQHTPQPPVFQPQLSCIRDAGGICTEACNIGIFTVLDNTYSCAGDGVGSSCCLAS